MHQSMQDKRPPSIETVRAVLTDGAVKLRFAEDTKPVLLDLTTASAMIAVYDAASPENKAKVDRMLKRKVLFLRYVDFCWKHVKVAS